MSARLVTDDERDWNGAEALSECLERMGAGVDLAVRAEPLGGWMRGERLAFHCLGKVFELNPNGSLSSECHQNPWLHVPMLHYVLDSTGSDPKGDWVRAQELPGFGSWVRFFEHSCIGPLLSMAQKDPTLLLDILGLFAKEEDLPGFSADASFVLFPLPKVPFLFSYLAPDEEFETGFSVFFDRTASENLDPESLFRLGFGMSAMFQKIAARHGGS